MQLYMKPKLSFGFIAWRHDPSGYPNFYRIQVPIVVRKIAVILLAATTSNPSLLFLRYGQRQMKRRS